VIGGVVEGGGGAPAAVRGCFLIPPPGLVASVPRAARVLVAGFSVLAVELGDAGCDRRGSPTGVRRRCARRRLASGAGPGAEGTGRWAFAGL